MLVIPLSSPAYAEHLAPADQFCAPVTGSGSDSKLFYGGKPVSLLSGVEYFRRTDLTIGSLFPITVTRQYDSSSAYDSPLGYGWALDYDKRLYTYPDGSIVLRKDCGGKSRFTWNVSGYSSSAGDPSTLVQNADGTYTYTDKYGQSENYDAQGRLTSKVDTKGNSLVFTYESSILSSLWGLSPWNINQSTPLIVAYDYQLVKIEEDAATGSPTGVSVTFSYDTSTNRLIGVMDSAGRSITYSHDNIGNLIGVSNPSGNISYGYNDSTNNHLLTDIDEGQGAYTNTYDTYGRVIWQTHGTGAIEFAYTIPSSATTITTYIADNSGNLLNAQGRTVNFDSNGALIMATDTFGNVTTYTRDANSWITQEGYWENTGTVSTPNLVLTTAMSYTYDTKGNMLSKTEALGTAQQKTTTYTYHPTFSFVTSETVTSVVDPSQNKVITKNYDNTNGNLLSVAETGLLGNGTPYSYTTTYGYDGLGHVTSISGPRTDVDEVTTYTYDPVTYYRTSMTQPIVGTTTYSNFDPLGNPQTVTDPNGNSTTYTYDATGRVLTVKAPGDSNPTQLFYVSGGCSSCGGGTALNIDHITLPSGNTIWYTYDAMGNLATIKDSLNNSINYTYDSAGNKLTEQINDASGALQKSLSYQYDALNRLYQTVNPDTTYTQYGYDNLNNRTSAQNPKLAITNYTYDALSRLTSVVQPGTITTAYGYNANNNLTSVTDANSNTTTYKYDDKGRVYQVISPDTGTTTYSYDPAGNLIAKTDAKGVTISYTYDALNRLTNINFPSDPNIVYTYDTCPNGKGRLCSMTDASGSTNYVYTPKGQVSTQTNVINSIQYVTQYTYDQDGNVATMTYPSGRVITYDYTNDRAVSVLNNSANLATNITYKPFGGMSAITYGNGLTGSVSYDNQYRITAITDGAVMNLSYPNYDADGNINAITNVLDATKNKSYGYDALDRLNSATGSWGSVSWTYDGAGNRLTEGSNSYTYAPNTNKLTGANGISYGYDNDGNTTSQGAIQYIYNQNQRLIQANNGGTTAYYTYNGNGQRVMKDVNGTTTIFIYSLTGQIIAESNSAGNITVEYVYLNRQPLAQIVNGNTYYYHPDHLGTPHKMTDATGTVVWSAYYKPFGAASVTVSTITNNLRLPGQYFDAETGLNYNYYRDYSSVIGRYLESDPLMLPFLHNRSVRFVLPYLTTTPGHLHDYLYVENNPIHWVDSKGLLQSSGSGPSGYPGNEGAACNLNNASSLIYGHFNMGAEYAYTPVQCCEEENCNPTCPSDKGPWLTKPNSDKCVCVKWKTIMKEY